jgi:hypothetical protein
VNQIIETIKTRGYWQVIIRPALFEENKIEDILSLFPLIEKNRVQMRGWDFPHINYKSSPNVDLNWVSQSTEWEHHLESWRFYQSGLFIHVGSIHLDWRDRSNWWPADEHWKPGQLLGIGDSLFRFAEVFEFAARLAMSEAGADQMIVEITIGNLKNRALYMDDQRRWGLFQHFSASINEFPFKRLLSRSQLVGNSKDLAIDGAHELFKRFSWQVTREQLDELYEDLLKRK